MLEISLQMIPSSKQAFSHHYQGIPSWISDTNEYQFH